MTPITPMTPAQWSHPAVSVLAYALLIVGAVIMLMPLAWMVSASLKPMSEIIQVPPTWIPQRFTTESYREMFAAFPFGRYFLNSLVTTGVIIGFVVATSVMAGYALARFDLPGARLIFLLFMCSLMVPFQSRMIPLFEMVVFFRLPDTYAGLVFPFLFDAAGIFLMRQFIRDLPQDLIDAARMDGASEWRILLFVVVPLLKPAIAALTILTFSGAWEEFLWPLVVSSSDATRTVPLGLQYFSEQYGTRIDLQMAGSTLAALPVILGFLILQKQFIEGITMTGVKG